MNESVAFFRSRYKLFAGKTLTLAEVDSGAFVLKNSSDDISFLDFLQEKQEKY